MLTSPKGLKYWFIDKDGKDAIKNDAPEWAKQEFNEYHQLITRTEKPDDKGIINQI